MRADGVPNQRLTEVGYWDGVHAGEDQVWTQSQVAPGREPGPALARAHLKSGLKKLLGARLLASMRAYDHYLLWEVILPMYLGGRPGAKVMEIGSAPGEFLVRLNERFGLVPYGIEYSPRGAELNRRLFATHGLDPDNVIQADFFAPEVHERYRGSFDVVLSRGFIEHFRDVEDVVGKHLNLVRQGGLLVVIIPNLRGVNLALSWLFHREVVAMHNLDIMARDRFAALFPGDQVEPLFCDYFGTFSFYLFNTRPGSLMRLPLAACTRAQLLLNALFRLVLKDRGGDSPWFSPNLLFVGVKR
jgi:SAM-dependent methyltransferase